MATVAAASASSLQGAVRLASVSVPVDAFPTEAYSKAEAKKAADPTLKSARKKGPSLVMTAVLKTIA